MELQFRNPGFDYMIEKIMDFQSEDATEFWTAPLYYFYPQLDREYTAALSFDDKKTYIGQILRQVYVDEQATIDEKIEQYANHWGKYKEQITAALSDAFGIDCRTIFNDMVSPIVK